MRRSLGLVMLSATLWLVPAPPARAQVGVAFPGYGVSVGVNSTGPFMGLPRPYGGQIHVR